jgi:antitoxin component YwqK of YwqJK toxin-antitoxin module
MKFEFMILAGLSLLLAGCATTSKKVPVASTIERVGVVYQINDTQPFTGITTAFYMLSDRPKTSIAYRNGLRDGHQIEWLENGRKKEIITWHNGMRDGEQLQWYENEQEAFQGRMQQGKWVGECRGWYPDGRLAFRICLQDGQGNGKTVVIKWNKDNLVREFPDVQIDGEWIEWHASGRITRQEKYLNGKLIEKLR